MSTLETKKQWTTPVVTKVKLEFDKEMAANCHGSNKSSQRNNKGCGPQSSGTCWTNNKAPK